ncbi:recombinase family protein [Candidatus Enterococcus clewellii]|uniref:Resolvase/invertase-type recombinase catalytic domain-containing protein n=1 Tax=Candidatus Enterococcus clewellii TaxID=1834193 RepID=A0A242K4V9_9ENTE|nr:recombinase family protein [Enterococcus sp. 9E7_DIV0242]OTP14473.1 hypothetical protein A5888_002574 [Enterococcus sp. 9E7_DIV0242]
MDINRLRDREWSEEKKSEKRERRKEIRSAYLEKRQVEIIPSKKELLEEKRKKKRVAAYCRVSTYEEEQEGSFELQIQAYTEKILNNPDWEMAEVYADQGVSGTTLRNRVNFQRLLDDCRNDKVDLILVKSISRFTRNTLHFISINRELKALPNPVGIYIEDMGINTLNGMSEYVLNMMSVIAQGESEQKSNAIKWANLRRWERGIPFVVTNNLLGYSKDNFGKIIIDEEEAEIVKFIYNAFLEGANFTLIAKLLTQAKVPTPTGGLVWRATTVGNILKNEKYCGDVIMQKPYTVDCFTHKRKKNNGEKRKYVIRDCLPPIISKKDWKKVENILSFPYRKRVFKESPYLKENKVVIKKWKSGVLKGFIIFDPNWTSSDIQEVLKRID